ncbi:MAG: hypothetical protein LC648_05160 [Novosphingobium sp.]|nr:hypothetical protein [Novosphingobium sp.]
MSPAPHLLADAEWLAHRYVESEDRVRFVRVPRARHGEVPFLTDDCLGETGPAYELPATACLEEAQPGPLHLLFHSAFCGSTMLVRALDRRGTAMGLSEPVILNDLVGFRRRGADLRAVARAADLATKLLARPFGKGEAVVVKPSNVLNPLAELLLTLRPEAKAVFLYAPLETFLISVARKGLHCRLWARELAEGYLAEGYLAPLGLGPAEIFRQSDLQVAAAGWLAQHLHFGRLCGKLGPERLRTIDADAMTADPAGAIGAVSAHFGLGLDRAAASAIAAGPAFARHSKSGQAYSAAARRDDYAAAQSAHREEIAMVLAWAAKVAEAAEVSLDLPDRLLASLG